MANKLGRGSIIDLTGTTPANSCFKVIKRIEDKHTPNNLIKKHIQWLCLCDCKKEFITTTKQIRKGRKSCGCKSLDNAFKKSLSEEQAILRKVIYHYKTSAKKRKLQWELTEEHCTKLFFQNCHYCGSIPARNCNYIKNYKPIKVNGIDRVDNTLGYICNNCVTCCKTCNRAKFNIRRI